MHKIEQELIEASGFTPERDYSDRQDYLAALVRKVADLPDTDFENLSNETCTWVNKAVKSIKTSRAIIDFEGGENETNETERNGGNGTHDHETLGVEASSSRTVSFKPQTNRAPKKGRAEGESPELRDQLDEFGISKATKSHAVAMMFKEGCTMKDVKERYGTTHNNLVHRLEREGHKVERIDVAGARGKFLKITPKSEC